MDLLKLYRLYLTLPDDVKMVFHPFPFSRTRLVLILFVMIVSGNLICIVKRTFPKLGSTIIIALSKSNDIIGFNFFVITGKEHNKFVANVGILTLPSFQGMGIGSKMYDLLIKTAKEAGIGKFRVTVIECNVASTNQVKKIGYVNKGYALDEYWDGRSIKNVIWELDLDKIV